MVFPSHRPDRCYTTSVYTRSKSVNLPLRRGARFFFIPSLSPSICQSSSTSAQVETQLLGFSFKQATRPAVCPDISQTQTHAKSLFQRLQQSQSSSTSPRKQQWKVKSSKKRNELQKKKTTMMFLSLISLEHIKKVVLLYLQ